MTLKVAPPELKKKTQSWADVAGEASEAEYTEVKRAKPKEASGPKSALKKTDARAG